MRWGGPKLCVRLPVRVPIRAAETRQPRPAGSHHRLRSADAPLFRPRPGRGFRLAKKKNPSPGSTREGRCLGADTQHGPERGLARHGEQTIHALLRAASKKEAPRRVLDLGTGSWAAGRARMRSAKPTMLTLDEGSGR